jgi:hypothetical protein
VSVETLRITNDTKEALSALAKLSDDAVSEIAARLNETPFQVFPVAEAIQRVEKVKNSSPEDAKAITELLLSLWYSQGTRKRSRQDIATELAGEFAKTDDAKGFSAADVERLRRHLEKLLDNDKLLNAQNASSLLLDYERVFSVARVLSDIRPVFEGPNAERVFGGLVVHTLRVSYYKADGTTDEFYVAMDDDDIAQLSDTLIRAKAKSQQLKKVLEEGKKLQYIQTSSNKSE